jgi:hypothetical protein
VCREFREINAEARGKAVVKCVSGDVELQGRSKVPEIFLAETFLRCLSPFTRANIEMKLVSI